MALAHPQTSSIYRFLSSQEKTSGLFFFKKGLTETCPLVPPPFLAHRLENSILSSCLPILPQAAITGDQLSLVF